MRLLDTKLGSWCLCHFQWARFRCGQHKCFCLFRV